MHVRGCGGVQRGITAIIKASGEAFYAASGVEARNISWDGIVRQAKAFIDIGADFGAYVRESHEKFLIICAVAVGADALDGVMAGIHDQPVFAVRVGD